MTIAGSNDYNDINSMPAQLEKIRRARKDILRVLDRYRLTLPEVITSTAEKDADEAIWRSFKKGYEEVQEELFRETYPKLWRKAKKP